jgi:zinc finger protein
MSSTESKDQLFPSIGKVADQADQIEENSAASASINDGDEKVVTEIESLCMECHENVSACATFMQSFLC